MSRTVLKETATEKSYFPVTVQYYDESVPPLPITPDSAAWTLTDVFGNVINGRTLVDLSPDDNTDVIALYGDDLQILPNISNVRRVAVSGTYTSTAHGAGTPFVIEIEFEITPVAGV